MSEIATRTLLALAQRKRAISEHAQEHAFRAAVLDKSPAFVIKGQLNLSDLLPALKCGASGEMA